MNDIAKRIAEKWYATKRWHTDEPDRLIELLDAELKPLLAVVEAAERFAAHWRSTSSSTDDYDSERALCRAVDAYRAAQPQPQPAMCWKCNGHGTLKTVAENWELCGCILDRLAKLEGKSQ